MTHTMKCWSVKAIVALSIGLGAWMSGETQRLYWLGTLGGERSRASAVSADGKVVVGEAWKIIFQGRAFRWVAGQGMQDLNRIYAHLLKDGSELRVALNISPDGRYIAGTGYNAATRREEAFLLDTGASTK